MLSTLPKTFVTVVETGSITRAAEDLSLAKSAVSQNLKRLEGQLGVKLATRTTRRLSLTPAGERYYQKCKEIIALSQLAKTEMEAYGATPSGPITITAPHALIAPIVAPAMVRVMNAFPDLAPKVIADDARLDLIAEGIDMAITVGALPDSNLRARKIGTLRDVLCLAPELFAHAPSSDTPEFANWIQSMPYVAHVREPSKVTHRVPKASGPGSIELRFVPSFRSNTIEAIASFARQGLGIALLPDVSVAEDFRTGRLAKLCGFLDPEPIPIHALHAYDTLVPKSVHEVIEAVRYAFSTLAQPGWLERK